MAGDWIKIEHALPSKPEVMAIASQLGIDEFAVVGHLVSFWSWVDQNMSPNCPSVMGTKAGLDRVAGRGGFVDAMVSVGWLRFSGGMIEAPNYDHHLSESAKKRAADARKKEAQRKNQSKPGDKCPQGAGTFVPDLSKTARTKSGRAGGPEESQSQSINPPPTATSPDGSSLEDKSRAARLFIPEALRTDAFAAEWVRWKRHRSEKLKPLTDMEAESQLYELARQPEEAGEILRFSIFKGALNPIMNGDHKRAKSEQSRSEDTLSALGISSSAHPVSQAPTQS